MEKALEILKHYHNLCSQLFVQTGDEEYRDEYVKINEAIAELEEAIKPKSCDDCMFDYCGCSVQDSILRADNTATFETFCCNSFKPKG